jgi:hypothetical protein
LSTKENHPLNVLQLRKFFFFHTSLSSPQALLQGMNKFLKSLEVTFRRDPANYRPRVNKAGSVKDRSQKDSGAYFYMDDAKEDEEEEVPEKKDPKKKK